MTTRRLAAILAADVVGLLQPRVETRSCRGSGPWSGRHPTSWLAAGDRRALLPRGYSAWKTGLDEPFAQVFPVFLPLKSVAHQERRDGEVGRA